jgi:hypothetical protein
MIGGSGSGTECWSIHLTNGSESGRPKTCGSGGSGSGTLVTGVSLNKMVTGVLDLFKNQRLSYFDLQLSTGSKKLKTLDTAPAGPTCRICRDGPDSSPWRAKQQSLHPNKKYLIKPTELVLFNIFKVLNPDNLSYFCATSRKMQYFSDLPVYHHPCWSRI